MLSVMQRCLAIALVGFVAVVSPLSPQGGQAAEDEAFIRIVHATSDIGPVDLFVDGKLAVIGAPFASVTDPLPIAGGDHQIVVVPSGASPDAALLNSVVTIPPGTTEEIAIIGGGGYVTAVMFPVDEEPLDADRARFRIIHASPDIGPIDPAIAGGDVIFPTVEYLYASEYAEVPAGLYPMELRYAGSITPAVVLPELTLQPGTVNDIYVIGQGMDGTLQTFQVQADVDVMDRTGRVAALRSGSCDNLGDRLADEWTVLDARGETFGTGGEDAASSLHVVYLPLDALISAPSVLTVRSTSGSGDNLCVPVGGQFSDDGAMVLPLRDGGRGPLVGIAVLSVGVEDPESVDIAIHIVGKSGEVPVLAPTATPVP